MAKYQLTYERVVDLSTKINIMFQKGLTEYVPMYSKIAPTFDSNGRANTYPLGRLPAVKEWLDDTEREIMKLEEAHYTLVNRKFEATLTIDREDIEDDQTSFYESQSEFLGKEAAQHPDHLCAELILNGFTENGKCYDGMPFFSNAHKWGNSDKTLSNFQDGTSEPWLLVDSSKSVPAFFRQNRLDYIMEKPADLSEYTFMKDKYVYGIRGRSAFGYGLWQFAYGSKQDFTEDNFENAYQTMLSLKKYNGNFIGAVPNKIVVGPKNYVKARKFFQSDSLSGSTNIWKGQFEVVLLLGLTSDSTPASDSDAKSVKSTK